MVLTGHHPKIKFINLVRDKYSLAMNSAQYQKIPTASINLFNAPSFYETEMLGYSLPLLCNNCQSCMLCTVRPGYTVRETQELQLMRQNIWHNADNNTVTVSYPVKPSGKVKPEHFRDNKRQAVTRAESTMRSLKSRGLPTQYNSCVKDYIDRGVWRKTSREEINAWKAKGNPVHFVAHHGIEKLDSLSTQLRIVVDSLLRNCWSGPRLIRSMTFTKRLCLQAAAQNFDLLGMIAAYTVRFKLAEAVGASYHTALLTSKSRVTPKHGMTPPRSELQGLIIAVRLVDKIIQAFTTKPARVTLITDSQCSMAALDVNASSLATFFANRALEIANTMTKWGEQLSDAKVELEPEHDSATSLQQSSVTKVDLVQHTPGPKNPADWPT